MNIETSLAEFELYEELYADEALTESDQNFDISILLSVLDEDELKKVLSLPELPMKFLIGNYKHYIEEIQYLED